MNLTPRIQKAIIKAAVLHYFQKRKGDGSPYIIHPYSVTFILANYTDNEDVIISGLLHDVLEDVPNYSEIQFKKDFGNKIYKIVKEVSGEEEDATFGREEQKSTWRARKGKYLKRLKSASLEAMMVCAADKIHNITSLMEAYRKEGNEVEKKFNASLDRKLWFYGEVLEVLRERLDNEIVKELKQVYSKSINLIKPNESKKPKN